MDYLNRILGIHVTYIDDPIPSIPNYIHTRYRMRKADLDGKKVVFVYPIVELDSINAVKKHLDRIEKTFDVPAVLMLEHISYRQKEYLLRDHIPFVVEDKQIYLPFMAVYLQQRCDAEKQPIEVLLPSAQVLLLYYIYHGCGELLTSDAAQKLSMTAMTVSRASKQLEDTGLLKAERRGVQKVIFSDRTPKDLFETAEKILQNPVKRTVYIPKKELGADLLLSGYSALSDYSMLNPPSTGCYASGSIAMWAKSSSNKLENSEEQCAVELWRYDPKTLTEGRCVDRLSLALALRDDRDERTEEAAEEMLAKVWRDIDGMTKSEYC